MAPAGLQAMPTRCIWREFRSVAGSPARRRPLSLAALLAGLPTGPKESIESLADPRVLPRT